VDGSVPLPEFGRKYTTDMSDLPEGSATTPGGYQHRGGHYFEPNLAAQNEVRVKRGQYFSNEATTNGCSGAGGTAARVLAERLLGCWRTRSGRRCAPIALGCWRNGCSGAGGIRSVHDVSGAEGRSVLRRDRRTRENALRGMRLCRRPDARGVTPQADL
jgi:hypothetical protein